MNLLDSSFLIAGLRRSPRPAIALRLDQLLSLRAAAINGVVAVEVLVGYKTRELFDEVRSELAALTTFEITAVTWDLTAILGLSLRRVGLPMQLPDLVIAASAIEHDATLIHADSDFDLIAEHSDLKVESYVGAV